jgi:protein-L-isoaspartate(D-aspartate) O-methyltransferase
VQARSLELAKLTGHDRVLEVGTGSGYQTALLALCAEQVFSVERIPTLALAAKAVLEQSGIRNVSIMVGDGTLGWRPYAPFDVILVAAATPEVPQPLVEQLKPAGRLILPLGDRENQTLTVLTRGLQGGVSASTASDVRFVPLIGQFGFAGESAP